MGNHRGTVVASDPWEAHNEIHSETGPYSFRKKDSAKDQDLKSGASAAAGSPANIRASTEVSNNGNRTQVRVELQWTVEGLRAFVFRLPLQTQCVGRSG